MIIWINGAFGSGKSSVARRITALLPGARLFDPEQIGFLLRRLLPRDAHDDFQDLPLWRELTVRLIAEAAGSGAPIVVPMTLVHPAYHAQIIGGLRGQGLELHHYTLRVSAETVRRRLRRRLDWPASRRWALERTEACVAGLADEAFAVHLDAERRSVGEIASEILADLQGPLRRCA